MKKLKVSGENDVSELTEFRLLVLLEIFHWYLNISIISILTKFKFYFCGCVHKNTNFRKNSQSSRCNFIIVYNKQLVYNYNY